MRVTSRVPRRGDFWDKFLRDLNTLNSLREVQKVNCSPMRE